MMTVTVNTRHNIHTFRRNRIHRCPVCDTQLRRHKSYAHSRGVNWHCPNQECPLITVKAHYRDGATNMPSHITYLYDSRLKTRMPSGDNAWTVKPNHDNYRDV